MSVTSEHGLVTSRAAHSGRFTSDDWPGRLHGRSLGPAGKSAGRIGMTPRKVLMVQSPEEPPVCLSSRAEPSFRRREGSPAPQNDGRRRSPPPKPHLLTVQTTPYARTSRVTQNWKVSSRSARAFTSGPRDLPLHGPLAQAQHELASPAASRTGCHPERSRPSGGERDLPRHRTMREDESPPPKPHLLRVQTTPYASGPAARHRRAIFRIHTNW